MMQEEKSVLLIVGSPRGSESTSASLGSYLLKRLSEKGWKTETLYLCPLLTDQESTNMLLDAIEKPELVIFSIPVYVDSLPSTATKALEIIAAHTKPGRISPKAIAALRQAIKLLERHNIALALELLRRATLFLPPTIRWILLAIAGPLLQRQKISDQAVARLRNYVDSLQPEPQKFLAISNSGFPEAKQSQVALHICRQFASDTGRLWMGGMALGGGAAIDGKPLEKCGGMVRNVKKALDIAAEDLSLGQTVSEKAIRLMAKPLAPNWLYVLMGNLGWRWKMWKNRQFIARARSTR